MDLSASTTLHADHAHVAVAGELDASTALRLRRQFDDALAQGCLRFTLDVAGLTFVDAIGLDAFVRLHNATTRLGGAVSFVATSPAFRRSCGLAGLTEAFGLSALWEPVA
jgi:anti-sigma B factor antagonist